MTDQARMPNAEAICRTAAELVGGERTLQHGDKLPNHQAIADLWNAYLEGRGKQLGYAQMVQITALDVAVMMIFVKIARTFTGRKHNLDNFIDMAGYSGVAGEIAELSQPRGETK